MHFEQSAILTVHNHVITRNPRISVTHDKHDKHRTWFLHISNVQEEDKGRYMCQINTVTAKTQFGYLHVVGKAKIYISFLSFALLCLSWARSFVLLLTLRRTYFMFIYICGNDVLQKTQKPLLSAARIQKKLFVCGKNVGF